VTAVKSVGQLIVMTTTSLDSYVNDVRGGSLRDALTVRQRDRPLDLARVRATTSNHLELTFDHDDVAHVKETCTGSPTT